MSDLSPETRALLERARGGDGLPRGHRRVLRRRLAAAAGVAAPLSLSATAAAMWVARGIAVLGATAIVHAVAVAPAPSPASPGARPLAVQTAPASVPATPATPRGLLPPLSPSATPLEDATPEPSEAAPPASARSARVSHPPPPRVAIVETTPVVNLLSAAPSESALTAEVSLVGDAQRALRAGDPERSLTLLGEHEQRFPAGALGPEAAVLRVDALCAAGRVSDAEAAARRFEAQYPGSPLARPLASGCARAAVH